MSINNNFFYSTAKHKVFSLNKVDRLMELRIFIYMALFYRNNSDFLKKIIYTNYGAIYCS